MTIKDLFAPGAWRLGGASVRRAAMTLAASTTRRAAMMLLMMMLTTATAWAQDEPEFTPAIKASYQFQAYQIKPTFEEVTVYGNTYSWSEVEVSYEKNLHVKDGGTIHVFIPDINSTFDVGFAITPAPLTVTAGSATKAYDGTPLTCDTYTVEGLQLNGSRFVGVILTGSQLNVGESDNVPSGGLLTDDNMSDISDYDITYVNGTLTVTPNPADWEETNTNEYTIKTATGWDIFCDLLAGNAKGYFDGKTVKLGANISVTRMAGSDDHDFTGTFDGNGHTLTVSYGSSDSPISEEYAAPFRYVDGVTIENLRVSGTIYTSAKFAGGFIGIAQGSASIVNSTSGVTINSSIAGDGTHGGFVGLQGDNEGNTLGIEGCVFNGKLLGSSTNSCGGFVGWRKKTVNILNSLYAPAAATGSETWIDTGSCATFSRNNANFTNCYYTQTLGTAQGKQRRSIAAGENVTVAHAGVATTYDVSGITAYKASAESSSFTAGLVYNNVLYAGWRDAVSLTLANTPPTGYSSTYTTSPDGATLTRDGDNYTLTMPDADVTIGATFMELVSVSYIDADGKEQTVNAFALQGGGATTIPAGWYVVNSDVTYTGTVTLGGDVNIILADGMTMTVNTNDEYGIKGTSNALTIYGTGTLNANRTIYCAFTMTGGTVNATSNPYAILGTTTVSGGTLNATGQYAIYGNVTVTGGTLTVTSTEGLTRSDWPSNYKRFAITGNLALSGPATFTLNGYVYKDVTIADGLTFTDGTNNYSGTLGYAKQYAIQGKTLTPFTIDGNAILYDNDAGLPDNHRNAKRLTTLADGQPHDIMLLGRTLYKDGDWNTLCLPFDVTVGSDVMADATAMTLRTSDSGFNSESGELTLNFDAVTSGSTIAAGTPFIAKWTGSNVTAPVFSGVSVSSTTAGSVTSTDGYVTFVGTYKPEPIFADPAINLYLGSGNKLYWPSSAKAINSFRAYFQLNNGLTAGEPAPTGDGSGAGLVRAFNLNFDDEGETTGIVDIEHGTLNIGHSAGAWYSLTAASSTGSRRRRDCISTMAERS